MTERSAAPPRAIAPIGRRSAPVLSNEALGPYRLVSVTDAAGPTPRAGQFYMLSAAERWSDSAEPGRPFLPRAFSVCRVAGDELGFLVEVVGPGTDRLARLEPGEDLYVTGPLGRGFDPPAAVAGEGAVALLVGGGVGVPPLAVWESELGAAGAALEVLLGFRSEAHLEAASLFASEPLLASEEGGSAARRGLVTELLRERLDATGNGSGPQGVAVYSCGPPAMLEAVRALCAEREAPAQLALESGMACGFGACFGCVVETARGYVRLCVDGPVLDAAELETALLPGGHG